MCNENHQNVNRERTQLAERIRQFTARREEYIRPTYNETLVRIDFVNPFFRALGWDIDNEAGLPQHLREVTHEASVFVEEDGRQHRKKPDYSFRLGSETLFYLETKKPSVDITTDNSSAFQLRRYGWSGNLKISILTNFVDLYIYDCSVRPVETDDVNVALIAHYSYTEYEDKFDEIYGLLSKNAVSSGAFATQFANIHTAFRHEPFNDYFLNQIKLWRFNLGVDIHQNNPNLDEISLNISVQRILNRIVFLRICEDRCFEQYENLKHIKTYNELRDLFISADQKYDSGLFAFLEEDRVNISDNILLAIFCDLYYPNNSYEFSVVDSHIIGQIYELFLAEKLVFINENGFSSIKAIKKEDAIDSLAVVNTPKNVTDIIVEQSLAELFEGKSIQDVQSLRILDICCGSGTFLLSAYEYIINHHIDWLINHERETAIQDGRLIFTPGTDTYRLSYPLRRGILERNIWGVDIDPLAVEVSKFSLLLKLLENTNTEEIDAYVENTGNSVLPWLNNNIKNGNSLVDGSYAQYDPDVIERDGALDEIKMFDWTTEFNPCHFDAIIGNPPYIRVQNMVHFSPREYAFYKSPFSGFQTANSELLDKYYLFIERAWNLLKENGVIGYIVPHRFMNIKSGQSLRHFLTSRNAIHKIIHLGTRQVFKDKSTYTCILILKKQENTSYGIAFVQDANHWNQLISSHRIQYETYSTETLGDNSWTFIPPQVSERLTVLHEKCNPLGALVHIFVGVQTSNDKIYIITPEREDDLYVFFLDKNGVERKIEKSILRKSIYDTRLQKYQSIISNSFIIFPYRNENNRARLIDPDVMQVEYPYALEYLTAFKDELAQRNMSPPRTEDNWYAYGRSQSIIRFVNGEHLIWPVLSLDSNYVYDNSLVVFTGGGNGPFYGIEKNADVEESLFYIQAILNHWLMELLVKKSASSFRGDYYSHGKQFVKDLPIYRINFSNETERNIHDVIVNKVHQLERLYIRMDNALNATTKESIFRAINLVDNELTAIIDRLYGVEELRLEEVHEAN